jgi:hypothetical protein
MASGHRSWARFYIGDGDLSCADVAAAALRMRIKYL